MNGNPALADPGTLICGFDEAGRGPMAGPVCASAVILSEHFDVSILNDSKKLSEKHRLHAAARIRADALFWCVQWASPEEIDRINILQASLLAMRRAWLGIAEQLALREDGQALRSRIVGIVDGLYCPDIDIPAQAFPKADGKYPAVMAASILAKTERDALMVRMAALYPEYGYEKHKGYPTAAHIAVLKKRGPSPIQRHSFTLKGEGQLPLFGGEDQ